MMVIGAILTSIDLALLQSKQMHIVNGRVLAGITNTPKPPEKPKQDKTKQKEEGK